MLKTLGLINKLILSVFILVLPSFVLTSFVNVFDFPKTVLLIVVAGLTLTLFAIETAMTGKAEFKVSNVDLPLIGLVVAFVLSAVFRTQNKAEAFIMPGTVTILISSFVVYLLAKKAFSSDKKMLAYAFIFSALFVSLISIFAYLGLLAKIPQLPSFAKDIAFSPLGGKLPEVIFLSLAIPINIFLALKEADLVKRILYSVISVVIILATILGITLILPGKPTAPVLVDFGTSWWVGVETLKVSPILGIGSGNYLTAFNKFLPLSYNSTTFWAVRFSTARSFVFTLMTENGLLGLVAFLITVFVIFKDIFKSFKRIFTKFDLEDSASVSLLILIVSFFIFPANIVLVFSFFVLLAMVARNHDLTLNLSATFLKNGGVFISRIPSLIFSVIILVGLGFLLFFGNKAVLAEAKYKTALEGLGKNDGRVAYDNLREAIATNTYVDRYHAAYAQVNLALARGLAQKKDLTDADKSTIAQLIQQTIREAKATVTLNPQRSGNWEVLGRTYQTILGFAQGADQFAIQSYSQAVALDPINPNLRISLGGVYYALGKYDNAIDSFKLAVLAKPDLANAHYNLAIAYRDKKDFDSAIAEINTVLTLVKKDSADYTLAKTTLEDLQKNKATKASTTDNLSAPQPAQKSNINPPITLPQEASPPVSQ